MKKIILGLVVFSALSMNIGFCEQYYDDYSAPEGTYYQTGLNYLQNNQYTSAILEFKKALRENSNDLSSKIGITNAYISRAAYYNNKTQEYTKAANDLRSAVFYMKYYDDMANDYNTSQAMAAAIQNLDVILSSTNYDKSAKNRANTARNLRTQGEFAASAYEYFQLIDTPAYQKDANAAIGDIMTILGRGTKSVFYYERAVNMDSKNADLHLKLARAYDSIGNTDGAAREYNLALQNSSEQEDILASLEKIWMQKISLNNADAEAHANLGVVYQKQGKYDAAMAEYQKAESINPANVTTRLNMGTLYQYQKNYDGAISAYNSILQLYPNHVNAHIYKAQCLKELGRSNEAITEYRTVLAYEPQNTVAKQEIFDILKLTMSPQEVMTYLYQNGSADSDSFYDFAYELHKQNKLDDAITFYNETIKLNPQKEDCYVNLSQAYRQKGDNQKALEVIQKAKAMFPSNKTVLNQYNSLVAEAASGLYADATNLFEQGKYQEAITKYLSIQPQTDESTLGVAASYQALENYPKALEYYKKALALDATNADIPYYLGSVYMNLNDYANAKTYLNKAIAMNPSNAQAKNLLKFVNEQESNSKLDKALDLYDKGNFLEALKLLNAIIAADVKNGTAYYYRGLVYDAQKKYNLAIIEYQTALKYTTDLYLAYYSMAVDYDTLGKYQLAKSSYQKYLASGPELNEYTKYARKRVAEIK